MIMRCSHCGVCCTETEMPLSKKDITRLERKNLGKDFVNYDSEGYAILKNREGYCVFYDRHKQRCSVYSERPAGCRVYPVIFDEEKGIVTDSICECTSTISESEKELRGKKVIKLLEVIDHEALERH
jgi:uncharacterized protein